MQPEPLFPTHSQADPQHVLDEIVSLLEEMEAGPRDARALPELTSIMWVNSHLPIGWPTMPKGLFPKVSAYAKKITRRLLRWYINPIVDQQNNYNGVLAETIIDLRNRVTDLEQKVLFLEAELAKSKPVHEGEGASGNGDRGV